MSNYKIVLFKDKKKRKIIKEFKTEKKAQESFNKLLSESDEVIFDKLYENGKLCKFELALVGKKNNYQLSPVYLMDELGRNRKVRIENDDLNLIQISMYKLNESIFDIERKSKISFDFFIRNYMRGDEMKMLYCLNNKIILQKNSEFKMFSLKNREESQRFIDCVSKFFFKNKKTNCLFIKDTSSAQKKYLIKILSENGFEKKILYRQSTTHPRVK